MFLWFSKLFLERTLAYFLPSDRFPGLSLFKGQMWTCFFFLRQIGNSTMMVEKRCVSTL